MGHTRYELHVQLRDIEPPIWRTIEVPGDASLEDVHFAIQVAMGWANSHLHHFAIGKQLYGMVDVDGTDDLGTVDERAYPLQDVAEAGAELVYEYDFGDRWEHDVTVTKVSTVAKPTVPRCLAGARACPPEDVGGPAGYDDLLEILGDAQHTDHASAVTWSHGFSPDAWKLPKGGLDLRAEMNELRRLADEAEIGALAAPHARGDSERDGDGDGDGDGDALQLPQELVDAVLALEPMQRAALSALLAGSLAEELAESRAIVESLLTSMRTQPQQAQPKAKTTPTAKKPQATPKPKPQATPKPKPQATATAKKPKPQAKPARKATPKQRRATKRR